MGYRAALLLVALAALAVLISSHTTPVSSTAVDAVVAVAAVLGLGQCVRTLLLARRRGGAAGRPDLGRLPAIVFAPFGLVLLATLFAGVAVGVEGNATNCAQAVVTPYSACVPKLERWKADDGKYYVMYPYTADGDSVPDPQWVPVSRSQYIVGDGSAVRSGAGLAPIVLVGLGYVAVCVEALFKGRSGASRQTPPAPAGV